MRETAFAIGTSLAWGASAVVFGLLPIWITVVNMSIATDASFSEAEFLKGGAIIIFAITLTISVLIDHYLSTFRFQGRFLAFMLNAFFPMAICVFGVVIHVTTIKTANEVLNTSFVLRADIALAVLSLIFCIAQKAAFLVHSEKKVKP